MKTLIYATPAVKGLKHNSFYYTIRHIEEKKKTNQSQSQC